MKMASSTNSSITKQFALETFPDRWVLDFGLPTNFMRIVFAFSAFQSGSVAPGLFHDTTIDHSSRLCANVPSLFEWQSLTHFPLLADAEPRCIYWFGPTLPQI
jgi:hypothetical protein